MRSSRNSTVTSNPSTSVAIAAKVLNAAVFDGLVPPAARAVAKVEPGVRVSRVHRLKRAVLQGRPALVHRKGYGVLPASFEVNALNRYVLPPNLDLVRVENHAVGQSPGRGAARRAQTNEAHPVPGDANVARQGSAAQVYRHVVLGQQLQNLRVRLGHGRKEAGRLGKVKIMLRRQGLKRTTLLPAESPPGHKRRTLDPNGRLVFCQSRLQVGDVTLPLDVPVVTVEQIADVG